MKIDVLVVHFRLLLGLLLLVAAACTAPPCQAQGALLMEQPYGIFGTLNPTGHNAIYLARVCAETPVRLRRCQHGEQGAVIARYQGIDGYDWIAMPLVPYLYSVENAADVPERVDAPTVGQLRDQYHERHLMDLGPSVGPGSFFKGGWKELVGVSYERRTYAFRFNTTEAQDDTLIAKMNAGPNQSHFNLLFSNCADYARQLMNFYFKGAFERSIFPDAGMTTPKQIAYKLTRYARKHPEMGLAVYEIPQIPGLHRESRSNKDVSESLVTSVYAVPLVVFNPYLAGGILVDYLVRGRYHMIPRHPEQLAPTNLAALTEAPGRGENRRSASLKIARTAGAAMAHEPPPADSASLQPGPQEGSLHHE